MSNTSTFKDLSKEVAERFLQTVVVVDDLAFLHDADRVHPHDLVTPGRGVGQSAAQPIAGADTVDDSSHELDAKTLIDTFAEKGLVCSVLRPKFQEAFEKKALNAAERADIVVLDWQIQGLHGNNASDLLSKMIGYSVEQSARLRLICIYTAEKLVTVLDQVEKTLQAKGPITKEIDEFTLILGATRICIFAKEHNLAAPPSKVISVKTLPTILIDEFAKQTMGLLSNVVLESLAALRLNTHRILTKFHSGLDAPYLSHRALTSPPEEAEMHPVPLVISEIQSVLEDYKVYELVSAQKIDKWLDCQMHNNPPLHRRMHIRSKVAAKEAMMDLLRKGIQDENKSRSQKMWKKLLGPIKNETSRSALSKLTDILTPDGQSGEIRDRELALLMSTRSQYRSPPPILTLGTIVAEDIDETAHYYVCIQPKCDSIRLPKKGWYFPFLTLNEVVDTNTKDFGYLIYDKGNMVELRLSIKPHDSKIFHFEPCKRGQPVYASRSGDEWVFKPPAGGHPTSLRWVAELKPDHAQRLANDFAREISRVGLTESEWLRRCAKKR